MPDFKFKPGDKVKIIGPKTGTTGYYQGPLGNWRDGEHAYAEDGSVIGWIVDNSGTRLIVSPIEGKKVHESGLTGYFGYYNQKSLELFTDDLMDDEPEHPVGYPEGKTAKELGLKVGDRFWAVASGSLISKGDIVELARDDGSSNPFFHNINTGTRDVCCIYLCKLVPMRRAVEQKSEVPSPTFMAGQEIERVSDGARDTVKSVPGMPEYDSRNFSRANEGMTTVLSGWGWRKDWKAVDTTAHKFKVGDAVKTISQSYGWGMVNPGHNGIISGLDKRGCIYVDFPGQKGWKCEAKDLELLTAVNPSHIEGMGMFTTTTSTSSGTSLTAQSMERLFNLQVAEKPKKEGTMSNIINKARQLMLNPTEKLRREYGVHDSNGQRDVQDETGCVYDDMLMDILREEYAAKIDAKLAEVKAADDKDSKKK